MTGYEKRNIIFGLPKSLYLNGKAFGFKGMLRLSVLVSPRVHIRGIRKGCIKVDQPGFGRVKIGINLGPYNRGLGKHSFFYMKNGVVEFKGKANIAADSVINVSGGICTFGDNFSANNAFVCSCEKSITFGDNVLFGWNCTVIDGDGHEIIDNAGNVTNHARPVSIGNHVWIAANSTITKGASVADDSIIGMNSVVNKSFEEPGIVIAGQPGKKVKSSATWKR